MGGGTPGAGLRSGGGGVAGGGTAGGGTAGGGTAGGTGRADGTGGGRFAASGGGGGAFGGGGRFGSMRGRWCHRLGGYGTLARVSAVRKGPPERGALWRLAANALAVVLAGIPFAPTLDWYSGPLESQTVEQLSFARALWMHLSHEHDHFEGMALFALPSVLAVLSVLLPWRGTWTRVAMAASTVAIGALEVFFIASEHPRYGTALYEVGQFFGIQGMIPEDDYTAHAATLVVAGAAWLAVEVVLRERARRSTSAR